MCHISDLAQRFATLICHGDAKLTGSLNELWGRLVFLESCHLYNLRHLTFQWHIWGTEPGYKLKELDLRKKQKKNLKHVCVCLCVSVLECV